MLSKKKINLWLIVISCGAFSSIALGQNSNESDLRRVFKAIPSQYFNIHCCDGNADEFIRKYVTVEDPANGFMKGADTEEDPKYGSFEMALFRRPDGSYVVGFHSESLRWSDHYFFEYRNGSLKNVSKTIPQYSLQNVYELPQKGTTIRVYRKKYDHPGEPLGVDNSVKKGRKLYDLVWSNGKFVIRK